MATATGSFAVLARDGGSITIRAETAKDMGLLPCSATYVLLLLSSLPGSSLREGLVIEEPALRRLAEEQILRLALHSVKKSGRQGIFEITVADPAALGVAKKGTKGETYAFACDEDALSFAVSADGARVLRLHGSDASVYPLTGRLDKPLGRFGRLGLRAGVFLADGSVLVGGRDGVFRHAVDGALLAERALGAEVTALCPEGEGALAGLADGRIVRLGADLEGEALAERAEGPVRAIAALSGHVAALAGASLLRWDARALSRSELAGVGLAFEPDGTLVVVGPANEIRRISPEGDTALERHVYVPDARIAHVSAVPGAVAAFVGEERLLWVSGGDEALIELPEAGWGSGDQILFVGDALIVHRYETSGVYRLRRDGSALRICDLPEKAELAALPGGERFAVSGKHAVSVYDLDGHRLAHLDLPSPDERYALAAIDARRLAVVPQSQPPAAWILDAEGPTASVELPDRVGKALGIDGELWLLAYGSGRAHIVGRDGAVREGPEIPSGGIHACGSRVLCWRSSGETLELLVFEPDGERWTHEAQGSFHSAAAGLVSVSQKDPVSFYAAQILDLDERRIRGRIPGFVDALPGGLWAATNDGLVAYDPDGAVIRTVPKPAAIETSPPLVGVAASRTRTVVFDAKGHRRAWRSGRWELGGRDALPAANGGALAGDLLVTSGNVYPFLAIPVG